MMQELRDKIISNAHIRFLNGGIKWLNLDYIASDCSISRKTLNQYFNRSQLIDAVIESKIETYHQSLSAIEIEQLGPVEELTKLLSFTETLGCDFSNVFLRDLRRHYPKNWSLIDGFIKGSLKKLFIQNLINGVNQGFYRKAIDVELLTEIYFSTGLMLIESGIGQLNAVSGGKSIGEMNNNFFAGLTNFNFK